VALTKSLLGKMCLNKEAPVRNEKTRICLLYPTLNRGIANLLVQLRKITI